MLIFSELIEQHLEHLKMFFNHLFKFRLHINETKSQICLKQVNFLGLAMNQYRLKLQSEKISEIVHFKSPKNVTELKSSLEVIEFLRQFINECTILTAPLHYLLRKTKNLCGMTYVKNLLYTKTESC